MRIVTDSGTDTKLLQDKDLNIPIVPLQVTIGETSYRDGIDIGQDDFYS